MFDSLKSSKTLKTIDLSGISICIPFIIAKISRLDNIIDKVALAPLIAKTKLNENGESLNMASTHLHIFNIYCHSTILHRFILWGL